MRLVCPNCGSRYEVDESLFPEEGREVQCSNCEEVWVQYPVEEQPPIRLDPLARVEDAPQRPSERLDEAERGELAAAVREEVAALGDTGSDGRETAAEEDDDDILASLRAQIALEGGDFETKGEAKSQKRNLRAAAEAFGVDVDDAEKEEAKRAERRKWKLDEKESDAGTVPAGRQAKASSGRKDGLARALRQYEEEMQSQERRPRGMRRGFLLGLCLVVIGGGVYIMRDEFAGAYPPAAPYLDAFAQKVDEGRRKAEEIYGKYQPAVMEQVDRVTGGAAPAEGDGG